MSTLPQKRTSMQVAFSAWSAQMLPRLVFACMTAMAITSSLSFAQAPSPNGVKTLNPPGAIKAEGTWSLGARAGDFVFVAGMQGGRSGDQHIGAGSLRANSPGFPQHQVDCAIGGREPARLRA